MTSPNTKERGKPEPHFPPPTFEDVPEDRSKVKQTSLTEAGEIVVRGGVPVREFRDDGGIARPKALPPKPVEPVGSLGWICSRWADYLLDRHAYGIAKRSGALPPKEYEVAEAAYWEHFATKLTRKERVDLAKGRTTAILRPVEPRWEKGDVLDLTGKQSARVQAITRHLKGWRTEVVIEDFRSFFMKRTVGGSSKPKTDEHGFAPDPTPSEEERARFDGAYTQTEEQAVPDGGEVLEDKLHRRLHEEAAMKTAMAGSKGRVRVSKLQLEERLHAALKAHRRSTARHLKRQLDSLEEKERKAAA